MSFERTSQAVLSEIGQVICRVDPDGVSDACLAIAGARHVMLYGCGREGLMMQGFAMRLHHLGKSVSMQGDMAAPPLGKADLFVASAGPGELGTVASLMRTAREAGAALLFLTAVPDTRSAALASQVLEIPARTMANAEGADAAAPMGAAYEGALFVLLEAMVAEIADLLGQDADAMRARHTNME